MIYYPVFGAFPSFYGGSMDDYLRDTVSIRKDVEGLSNTYRRNLYHNIRCCAYGMPDEKQRLKVILRLCNTNRLASTILLYVFLFCHILPVEEKKRKNEKTPPFQKKTPLLSALYVYVLS